VLSGGGVERVYAQWAHVGKGRGLIQFARRETSQHQTHRLEWGCGVMGDPLTAVDFPWWYVWYGDAGPGTLLVHASLRAPVPFCEYKHK
jgi:hypothetical protein